MRPGPLISKVTHDGNNLPGGQDLLQSQPRRCGRAEIRVGQRSVLSFLLRPMMQAQEAFTER